MATKTLTCSMTRANKILASLRESKPVKRNRYSLPETKVYAQEVNLLSFSENDVKKRLEDMRTKLYDSITKKRLLEKFKNRLFTLNVRYNIHDIMSEIEVLKSERTELNNVIDSYNSTNFISLESAIASMDAVKSSEKKYDFKWHVSAFDIDELKQKVKALTKRISTLDDRRDNVNIQNSFTLDLTEEEYAILDLE